YTTDDSKTPEQFLKDISATTNDGSPVTSDFDSVVNLNKAGTYEVTLRAVSSDGVEADPVKVVVTVENGEKPPVPPTPPTPPGPDPAPAPDPSPNPNGDIDSSTNNKNTSPNHQKSTKQASLPATGDADQDTMILIGIVLAGVAVLSFRKRKQY
ncbi:internalin-I, partial [Listeria ivanovii FSL F6-596]